jgi:hypothetical protein
MAATDVGVTSTSSPKPKNVVTARVVTPPSRVIVTMRRARPSAPSHTSTSRPGRRTR